MPPLVLFVIVVWSGPVVWAQERLRDLPDEQLRIQCALGVFYDGLLAEDRDVIRAFIHFDNDAHGELLDAQVRRLVANMRFLKAASKFNVGHESEGWAKFRIFLADDFAFAMLTGDWTIAGDRATVPPEERMGGPDQPPPPPLINVRGVWKVDLTPSNVASVRELAADITRYAEVLEQTAADINAGKLKRIDEVAQSLEKAPRFAPGACVPDLILAPMAQRR